MSLQVVANFRVIDETEHWVVVDKPAPLIVHPANNKPEPTLLGGLEKLYSYEIENGATITGIANLPPGIDDPAKSVPIKSNSMT